MVKKSNVAAPVSNENEVELLRQKVADLERQNQEFSQQQSMEGISSTYIKEMENIRARGNQSVSQIQYRDIQGYKAVYLYHTNGYRIGKRLGPFHPSNAEFAMSEFGKKGIRLSINAPTTEQVEAYKKTKEYLDLQAAFQIEEKAAIRSRRPDQIEKLTEQISKLAGVVVVNTIKDKHEVSTAR